MLQEPMSLNGLLAQFARSNISNTLFVGHTDGEPRTRVGASLTDTSLGKFFSQGDTREAQDGLRDATQLVETLCSSFDLIVPARSLTLHLLGSLQFQDNQFVHAFHMPGTGSELRFINCTVSNYQAAFMGCAWGSAGRGGYESEFEKITFKNVGQIASWYHKYSWIMVDIDGTLTGHAGGRLVPRSGLFDRNPNCFEPPRMPGVIGPERSLLGAVVCTTPVRRLAVNVGLSPDDLFTRYVVFL